MISYAIGQLPILAVITSKNSVSACNGLLGMKSQLTIKHKEKHTYISHGFTYSASFFETAALRH